tara:strand:- start:143 stop:337 length:195 start_codon:yes stop_codon:yes gene_type:complete
MKVTIDLKYFIPAVIAFIIAYMTVTYKIDNYIQFAGEANAFAFFICSSVMGCMLMIGAFVKDKK